MEEHQARRYYRIQPAGPDGRGRINPTVYIIAEIAEVAGPEGWSSPDYYCEEMGANESWTIVAEDELRRLPHGNEAIQAWRVRDDSAMTRYEFEQFAFYIRETMARYAAHGDRKAAQLLKEGDLYKMRDLEKRYAQEFASVPSPLQAVDGVVGSGRPRDPQGAVAVATTPRLLHWLAGRGLLHLPSREPLEILGALRLEAVHLLLGSPHLALNPVVFGSASVFLVSAVGLGSSRCRRYGPRSIEQHRGRTRRWPLRRSWGRFPFRSSG